MRTLGEARPHHEARIGAPRPRVGSCGVEFDDPRQHLVAGCDLETARAQACGQHVHSTEADPFATRRRRDLHRKHHCGRCGCRAGTRLGLRAREPPGGGDEQCASAQHGQPCTQRGARCSDHSRRGHHDRRRRERLHAIDGGFDALDRRTPPVAELRHRSDQPLRLSVVADRATRLQHDLAELRIGHVDPPPDRGDEFVAPDRAVTMFDQVDQAIEYARWQRAPATFAPQFARTDIDPRELECVDRAARAGRVLARAGTRRCDAAHAGPACGRIRMARLAW